MCHSECVLHAKFLFIRLQNLITRTNKDYRKTKKTKKLQKNKKITKKQKNPDYKPSHYNVVLQNLQNKNVLTICLPIFLLIALFAPQFNKEGKHFFRNKTDQKSCLSAA